MLLHVVRNGATRHDHQRVQEPHPGRAQPPPRDPDDGPGLLPQPVGGCPQAADLPDLDLRLRDRPAGQGLLRPHRGPPRAAGGREAGPGLLALQQPQFRDPRGSAGGLGPGRALGRVRQRHGCDRHRHAGVPAAGRHDPAQPPALWRHRDPDPKPAHRLRHHACGLHRRLRSRADHGRRRAGHGQGPRRPDHAGDPRQPHQRSGRPRGRGRGPPPRSRSARATGRRSPSTTRCSGRCTSDRCSTVRTCRSTP